MISRALLVACCLLPPSATRADDVQPPLEFQPDGFRASGGAVGSGFRAAVRVAPAELWEGDTAILTVRLSAASCQQPPLRPRLKELAALRPLLDPKKPLVLIDAPKGPEADRPDRTLDGHTWEFDYKLRPLKDSVTRLPPLPFDTYRPSSIAALPGRYQRTYSEAVPLVVKAKAAAPLVEPPPIRVPEYLLNLAEGPAVLRRQAGGPLLPSLPWLLLGLLLPPLAGVGWYVVWRRLFPDAVRRARLRQSRAARQAQAALQALGPAPDVPRVARVAATYLQARFGLASAEPTPADVTGALLRAGASEDLAGKAAEFFHACDAARFAPASAVSAHDLRDAAVRLIATVEAEPWADRF